MFTRFRFRVGMIFLTSSFFFSFFKSFYFYSYAEISALVEYKVIKQVHTSFFSRRGGCHPEVGRCLLGLDFVLV